MYHQKPFTIFQIMRNFYVYLPRTSQFFYVVSLYGIDVVVVRSYEAFQHNHRANDR